MVPISRIEMVFLGHTSHIDLTFDFHKLGHRASNGIDQLKGLVAEPGEQNRRQRTWKQQIPLKLEPS
jgi:hypothetical protein